MTGQQEPASNASAEREEVTWDDIMIWMVSPASECTLENPKYADFARRWEKSHFSKEMEIPAGGTSYAELVIGSMEITAV